MCDNLPYMKNIRRSDIAEQIIGASVLAFPVAVTEEVWNLSEQIPIINVILIAVVSCVFLAVFSYFIHSKSDVKSSQRIEIDRVFVTYGTTLLVCSVILLMVGKFPLFTETTITLKRVVLVAFPACFSATVVDSLK